MIKLKNILNELNVNNPHMYKTWKDKLRQLMLSDKKSDAGNDNYYDELIAGIDDCKSKEDIIKLIDEYTWGEPNASDYYIENTFADHNLNINEVQHIIYKIEVLIKVTNDVNRVFVYNSIRGINGVVVVSVEQNDYLDSQETDKHIYSLLKVKYMVTTKPEDDINEIKKKALITDKIEGLVQFLPRFQTIQKVGEY